MTTFNTDELERAFCEALNSVVKADPVAMFDLIEHRVLCNDTVLDESVYAVPHQLGPDAPQLGALGLINGLAVKLGMRRVVACYDDSGTTLQGFTTFWAQQPVAGSC